MMTGKRSIQLILVALTLLALPLAAWAKPEVSITIKAEKEVVVTEEGKQVKKIVEAAEIFPGETIIYTLNYQNTGTEPASNVAITDPIPAGSVYSLGSASEIGEVTFSIDQGQSFKKPSLLTYEVTNTDGTKEKRVASPEEYTHIRWTLPPLAPGDQGSVSFQVKVQ